jgi:hypothetical protein
MFDPLQIDPAQIRITSGSIHKFLRLVQDLDNTRLVLETFNILVTMSITTLQDFNEFFVESLNN